jgi:hypothetical protein
MPFLSNFHQLFDTQTCQAYIQHLRWKDRPFQCLRCQSQNVGPWGNYHYRSGYKRYRCRDCKRTFNDLTGTLFDRSKRSLAHWILATFPVPRVFISSHRQGVGGPYPHWVSLVLVATQRRLVL